MATGAAEIAMAKQYVHMTSFFTTALLNDANSGIELPILCYHEAVYSAKCRPCFSDFDLF